MKECGVNDEKIRGTYVEDGDLAGIRHGCNIS
jgi:hypothetical protein